MYPGLAWLGLVASRRGGAWLRRGVADSGEGPGSGRWMATNRRPPSSPSLAAAALRVSVSGEGSLFRSGPPLIPFFISRTYVFDSILFIYMVSWPMFSILTVATCSK